MILLRKKPSQDRTTHVELTPSAFLMRLSSLVPRPKKNSSLYFGVLAAHAKDGKKLVPKPQREATRKEDSSWAALTKHIRSPTSSAAPQPAARAASPTSPSSSTTPR